MEPKFNIGDEVYVDGKKGSFWVISLARTEGGAYLYCVAKSLVKSRYCYTESKLMKK